MRVKRSVEELVGHRNERRAERSEGRETGDMGLEGSRSMRRA